jgi:hypothetical protein
MKMLNSKAVKMCIGIFALCVLGAFLFRDQFIFWLDVSNEIEVQGHVVRMPINWHPYGQNSNIGSISFVESKSLPISDPGHIHFKFLPEVDEARKKALLKGAANSQQFSWGTAYVIPGKAVTEAFNMQVRLTQPIIFVPEFNLILDVLNPDDLRIIRDIHVKSKLRSNT